jgi:hypothetical protein
MSARNTAPQWLTEVEDVAGAVEVGREAALTADRLRGAVAAAKRAVKQAREPQTASAAAVHRQLAGVAAWRGPARPRHRRGA